MTKKKTQPEPKFINPQSRNTILPRQGGGNIVLSAWRDRDSKRVNATYVVEGEFYRQFADAGQLAPFPGSLDKDVPTPVEGNVPARPESDTPTGGSGTSESSPLNEALVEAVVAAFGEGFDPSSEDGLAVLTAAHDILDGKPPSVELDAPDLAVVQDAVADFMEGTTKEEEVNLDDMTKKELVTYAEEHKIEVNSHDNKDTIKEAIRDAEKSQ